MAKHQQAHDAVNTPPSQDPELMRRIYRLLRRCRASVGKSSGIEATLVGSLIGLLGEDTLMLSHANGIHDVVYDGVRPELLDLAPLDHKARELDAAAQIALAAGYALDRNIRQKPGLVLAFAGEADTLVPARTTLAFSALHKLPLVVVVQHNLERANEVHDFSHEMLGVGMPGMTVDGSDAMAIYRVIQEAMYRARHEGGPTLIECKTFRKAKIPARFRPWVQGDAVEYMEEQLRTRDFWDESLREG
jgi:dehydrogenase E1 component